MGIQAGFVVPHPPLIIPAVGRGEEEAIHATVDAYETVARAIAALEPETVVVISPHTTIYADYFHISPGNRASGNMGEFGALRERMSVSYDQVLGKQISQWGEENGVPVGFKGARTTELDHATFIPLWFIRRYYTDFKVVRIGFSGMDPEAHYRAGMAISAAADALGRRVVVVASGDLSHKLSEDGPYGFAEEGPLFDSQVEEMLSSADFAGLFDFDPGFCDDAAECGLRTFQMMAGALDGKAVEPQLLSHEGPFGVGYAVASFVVTGKDATRRLFDSGAYVRDESAGEPERPSIETVSNDPFVRLAKQAIETYVRTGERMALNSEIGADLISSKAGVFVSIKKNGSLRGCIGTVEPVRKNVAEEVIYNACAACSEDPRFEPVREEELPELTISVDVLGDPDAVWSYDMLDPARYGVIISNERKRGVLLPNLDGVDTVEDQISIVLQKAGLRSTDGCDVERFEVERHV